MSTPRPQGFLEEEESSNPPVQPTGMRPSRGGSLLEDDNDDDEAPKVFRAPGNSTLPTKIAPRATATKPGAVAAPGPSRKLPTSSISSMNLAREPSSFGLTTTSSSHSNTNRLSDEEIKRRARDSMSVAATTNAFAAPGTTPSPQEPSAPVRTTSGDSFVPTNPPLRPATSAPLRVPEVVPPTSLRSTTSDSSSRVEPSAATFHGTTTTPSTPSKSADSKARVGAPATRPGAVATNPTPVSGSSDATAADLKPSVGTPATRPGAVATKPTSSDAVAPLSAATSRGTSSSSADLKPSVGTPATRPGAVATNPTSSDAVTPLSAATFHGTSSGAADLKPSVGTPATRPGAVASNPTPLSGSATIHTSTPMTTRAPPDSVIKAMGVAPATRPGAVGIVPSSTAPSTRSLHSVGTFATASVAPSSRANSGIDDVSSYNQQPVVYGTQPNSARSLMSSSTTDGGRVDMNVVGGGATVLPSVVTVDSNTTNPGSTAAPRGGPPSVAAKMALQGTSNDLFSRQRNSSTTRHGSFAAENVAAAGARRPPTAGARPPVSALATTDSVAALVPPSLGTQSTRFYLSGAPTPQQREIAPVLSQAGRQVASGTVEEHQQPTSIRPTQQQQQQDQQQDFFKAANGFDRDRGQRPQKKFVRGLVCGTLVCLLIAAGVGVGIALGGGGGDGGDGGDDGGVADPTITPGPTAAPTVMGTTMNQIMFRQTLEAIIPLNARESSPDAFSLALDWYANLDPSLEDDEDRDATTVASAITQEWEEPHFLQRFLLIWTWFHTTQLGTQPWRSCNPVVAFRGQPPGNAEDVFEQGDTCEEQAFAGVNQIDVPIFETRTSIRYMSGRSECEWVHVMCNDAREVIAVDFLGNGMSGTSLPYFLTLLPTLEHIDISWQDDLTGTLPSDLTTWDSLTNVSFVGTPLRGPLPDQLYDLTNLRQLVVGRTDLSGIIASEIRNLDQLVELRLFRNSGMEGSIPTEVGLLSQLQILTFETLRLRNTPIPTEIGQLTLLTGLELSNSLLSGQIPESFVNLTNLELLELTGNFLAGSIPDLYMPSARVVAMGGNRLRGPIPESLYENDGAMEQFLFSDNLLSGSISESIGNFAALFRLQLQDNKLTGPIPRVLATLTNLKDLDLTLNEFVGSVPDEICVLRGLELLVLRTDCLAANNLPAPNVCACCTLCCAAIFNGDRQCISL